MLILGIDPGTRIAGFGIVELKESTGQIRAVTAGAWTLPQALPLSDRLGQLLTSLKKLLDEYAPSHLCLELAFVGENVRSALYLGHARGVVLAEACLRRMTICEMSATSIKKTLTNFGRADKQAVANMVCKTLNVTLDNLPYDATDALAIAYVYAVSLKEHQLLRFGAEASKKHSPETQKALEDWRNSYSKSKQSKSRTGRKIKDRWPTVG